LSLAEWLSLEGLFWWSEKAQATLAWLVACCGPTRLCSAAWAYEGPTIRDFRYSMHFQINSHACIIETGPSIDLIDLIDLLQRQY
jgi:hypothetical protein